MRKVVLFIAMSLDGYIADKDGKVDWLNGQSRDEENIDTYSIFVKDVDTVLMGWNTYHQIVTELSPSEWVYADLTSYVITHRELVPTDKIIFTGKNPCDLVNELKQEQGKDIWICGGANIIQQLMEADLIDQYYISVIPTILGSGIRLFGTTPKEMKLKLVHTQTYNGITDSIYERRQKQLAYHNTTEIEKREICTWKYEGAYEIYNLPPYEEMMFKNIGFCNDKKAKNFYSFIDGSILVGFVNILEKKKEVFIGIGVKPDVCNNGYGQRMLDIAYKISKNLYPDKPLYLEVRSWNKRAINCYKRAGFAVDGEPFERTTSIGTGLFYRMVHQ